MDEILNNVLYPDLTKIIINYITPISPKQRTNLYYISSSKVDNILISLLFKYYEDENNIDDMLNKFTVDILKIYPILNNARDGDLVTILDGGYNYYFTVIKRPNIFLYDSTFECDGDFRLPSSFDLTVFHCDYWENPNIKFITPHNNFIKPYTDIRNGPKIEKPIEPIISKKKKLKYVN